MKKIITVVFTALAASLFTAIIVLVLGMNTAFAGGSRTPLPPANLAASSGDGQIVLTWTASFGATKYNIYKKNNEAYLYLNQTTDTTYTDTGLTNGTTYYYSVTALNFIDEESPMRGFVFATPEAPVPPALPGVTIVQSDSSTNVIEGGANDTYTIVLNSAPTATVSVSLSPDPQIGFTPRAAEFTKTNWNVPQTITVSAVDDLVYEGPQIAVITHTVFSLDSNYNGISADSVTVNITDNDVAPGVIITQSGNSTDVAEGGTTNDTYTIVLNSVPTDDVTVTISSNPQVTVSPTKLVFASLRWNMPQTVTVAAVDDLVYEGNHTGTITHSVSSSDVNYNNISIANITVNITDNDPSPPSGGGGGGGGAAILEEKKKPQGLNKSEQKEKENKIAFGTDEEVSFEMPFVDISSSHWAYDFVKTLVLKDVVNGTTENTFEPDKLITRAELTKMVVSAFYNNIPGGINAPFADLEPNAWYTPYIEFAYLKNIVTGYGAGLFGPSNPATRAEALKIVLKTCGIELNSGLNASFSDIDVNAWYIPYLNFAVEAKIVAGYEDNTFKPNAFLTRAEAVKIITKSLELK